MNLRTLLIGFATVLFGVPQVSLLLAGPPPEPPSSLLDSTIRPGVNFGLSGQEMCLIGFRGVDAEADTILDTFVVYRWLPQKNIYREHPSGPMWIEPREHSFTVAYSGFEVLQIDDLPAPADSQLIVTAYLDHGTDTVKAGSDSRTSYKTHVMSLDPWLPPNELVITIVDGSTDAPIPDAEVLLRDPRFLGATDSTGVCRVPLGDRTNGEVDLWHPGYDSITVPFQKEVFRSGRKHRIVFERPRTEADDSAVAEGSAVVVVFSTNSYRQGFLYRNEGGSASQSYFAAEGDAFGCFRPLSLVYSIWGGKSEFRLLRIHDDRTAWIHLAGWQDTSGRGSAAASIARVSEERIPVFVTTRGSFAYPTGSICIASPYSPDRTAPVRPAPNPTDSTVERRELEKLHLRLLLDFMRGADSTLASRWGTEWNERESLARRFHDPIMEKLREKSLTDAFYLDALEFHGFRDTASIPSRQFTEYAREAQFEYQAGDVLLIIPHVRAPGFADPWNRQEEPLSHGWNAFYRRIDGEWKVVAQLLW